MPVAKPAPKKAPVAVAAQQTRVPSTSPQPVEVRVVATAGETRPESLGRKLIGGGVLVLLTGAMTLATAMWTGYNQRTVLQCEIARDVLMDDQLNPAIADPQRRM